VLLTYPQSVFSTLLIHPPPIELTPQFNFYNRMKRVSSSRYLFVTVKEVFCQPILKSEEHLFALL
jgi:hypothetical protein